MADDFHVSVESLYYDRQRLSALVFEPLQEIKDFVARKLSSDEVVLIVGFLRNAIRSDTLRTITDGKALIAVLNLYYGMDNLRVLQRLLRKINCHDLLEVLIDWDVSSNPVDTRVFGECAYFPLWIRVKSNFTWFSKNKKAILQTIRRLYRIPEITPGDPDYETVIFMGVSFGKTDLLVYVLVPLCTRKFIRTTLGRNDISLALQQAGISGVYFGRKSERNSFNDDPSVTSFSSINESLLGDYIKQDEDPQELHSSMSGLYNGVHEHNQRYFYDADLNQGVPEQDVKVVRASIGYIDAVPSANKSVEPIRVVWPKIMYLNHGNLSAIDVEDSPKKRAALDEEINQNIVKGNTDIVEQTPQSFNNNTLHEKSKPVKPGEFQKNAGRENLPGGEVEGLIVSEVKHNRKEDWNFPDENQEHAGNRSNNSENMKWTDYGEQKTSVLDFSEEDNNNNDNKGWQSYASPGISGVVQSASSVKPQLISAEKSKSDGKKMYTSTATLQVNRNRSTNYQLQPVSSVNGEMYRCEAVTEPRHSLHTSSWYEDAALEDYYREMIPEPEPGDTQQLLQTDEFYQHKMIAEEQSATPKTHHATRAINSGSRTPLFSPPAAFRDVTPTGSKLVKVKTTFFEQPVQQALLVSTDDNNWTTHDWDSSSLESDRLRQISRQATATSNVNRSPHHSPVAYNQNRLEPVFVHPRPFLMKSESKLESEYEDSVFTDTEGHGDIMTASRFAAVPPSYVPPPQYNGAANRSTGKLSDDSVSTDTSDRIFKTTLLSATSVSSIYREKEMFLSSEELQMSIRGAEDKEMERQMELCKELMIAAKAGDEEEVKRTIEEGVDIDYQNEFGQSAMMVASWEGHLGIVEALLSADADPNLQEGFGKSALHEAALSGHHTTVHRLISGGAKINLTDEEHRTPLHYAAMRGKRRIVEVLQLFGADVTLLTKYGESAVELAYSYRHDDIVDLLISSSRDKKIRKEMESQIRKQKLRQLSSATSLPNLSKVSSMKELSRSRSRPDLHKNKSVCSIQ